MKSGECVNRPNDTHFVSGKGLLGQIIHNPKRKRGTGNKIHRLRFRLCSFQGSARDRTAPEAQLRVLERWCLGFSHCCCRCDRLRPKHQLQPKNGGTFFKAGESVLVNVSFSWVELGGSDILRLA